MPMKHKPFVTPETYACHMGAANVYIVGRADPLSSTNHKAGSHVLKVSCVHSFW